MSAVSACDNSILWVTLRTGPATEEPHFYVTSSLTGPAHSQFPEDSRQLADTAYWSRWQALPIEKEPCFSSFYFCQSKIN